MRYCCSGILFFANVLTDFLGMVCAAAFSGTSRVLQQLSLAGGYEISDVVYPVDGALGCCCRDAMITSQVEGSSPFLYVPWGVILFIFHIVGRRYVQQGWLQVS